MTRTTVILMLAAASPAYARGTFPKAGPADSVPRYVLAVQLRPTEPRMRVVGSVHFPEARAPLRLLLSSRFGNAHFQISGRPVTARQEQAGGNVAYLLDLPAAGATAAADLAFDYDGGNAPGLVFSIGDDVSFASGFNTSWYPQLEGGGKATGTLSVDAPAGLTVVAAGRQAGSGAPTFNVAQPSYFLFVAGNYIRVESPAGAGAPPLSLLTLKPRRDGKAVLDGVAAMLAYDRAAFGTYPYESFAVVEVPDAQANAAAFQGASLDGAILVQAGYLDNFSPAYFAHEIAHQWWGVSVAHAGATGRYLFTEAMAQWTAERLVEQTQGADAAAAFRIHGFGGGATGYFDFIAGGTDHRPLDLPGSSDWLPVAWTKGMFMLDALERRVGGTAFRAALQRFQRVHAHREGTWPDFWHEMQSAAHAKLDDFSRAWLESTGAPELSVHWEQSGAVTTGTLTVRGPSPDCLRIEVRVSDRIGRHVLVGVDVRGASGQLRLQEGSSMAEIVIDPLYRELHWTEEFRERSRARAPYVKAERLRNDRKYAEAVELLGSALRELPAPDLHSAAFLYNYSLARIALDEKRYGDADRYAAAALAAPTRDGELLPWLYVGLAQLAQAQGDRERLKTYAAAAESADAAAGGQTGASEVARRLMR